MLFTGLSAFPITPADTAGHVDTDALAHIVHRLADARVDSIGLLGSTGCAPYLTRAERRRATEAGVAAANGRVPVMVGIGALRTSDVLLLAEDAANAGADALLLPPISYIPLIDDEVFALYQTLADAVPLPICVYNNPAATHFTIGPALLGRLSRISSVAAVKNPAPEPAAMAATLADLRTRVPTGFSLGNSGDARCAEALLAGAACWYSVLAGVLPRLCVPIAQAARTGDAPTAGALNARAQPLWDLFAAHSSLRVTFAIVNLLGISHAQPPLPMQPLGDVPRRALAAAMDALGLLP